MVNAPYTFLNETAARRSLALALACAATFPTALAAAPAPAGYIIESTAEATYDEGGVSRTQSSNTVQVRVDELLDVAAVPLDAGPVTVRGSTTVLSFLISNTGNGTEDLTLDVDTAVAGNAFDATLEDIAVDTNGNGVYDSGIDLVLTTPSVAEGIAAGATQTVFVIVSAPSGLADGATSAVNLTVRTATGDGAPGTVFAGQGDGGSDAVVGLSGGMAVARGELVASSSAVILTKSSSVTDPFGGTNAVPGATITYTIEAEVSGSAPVDGLVITDAIPARTSLVAGSLTLDGAPLSDGADGDEGEASAAGIAVTLGTVAAGSTSTITFTVLIEE